MCVSSDIFILQKFCELKIFYFRSARIEDDFLTETPMVKSFKNNGRFEVLILGLSEPNDTFGLH